MKKSRFSEERIIGFIKEAEAGMPVVKLCRKHGFSNASDEHGLSQLKDIQKRFSNSTPAYK